MQLWILFDNQFIYRLKMLKALVGFVNTKKTVVIIYFELTFTKNNKIMYE